MTGNIQGGQATILLAEDEPLLRELGETILSQAGYTVIALHRRSELESLFEEHERRVDLLLTDIVMPEMSGQEIAAAVRRRWPKVHVIYMSGYSADDLKDMDQRSGFLQKPFTPAELMAKVEKMLNS